MEHINSEGGLLGHPVRLIVYDDGVDPARHRAQVQDAIERQHVIAFLGNAEPFTGAGSVSYIESKRIPVIGGSTTEGWSYQSPMYFPQASAARAAAYAGLAGAAAHLASAGATKFGTLVCTEAQDCAGVQQVWAESAKDFGVTIVYEGRASIAQPDYTAECLSARNGGAQFLLVVLDQNSQRRVAAACARQGYHPIFSSVASGVSDDFKNDPNITEYGVAVNVFPYFLTGTAAADEFQSAMKRFGSKVTPGVGVAQGWTAGKELEKASAQLSEPPSSDALLKGLWSFKGETLGGITSPLTFTEGKPATPTACSFWLSLKKGAWSTPDGSRPECVPYTAK